jgi:hypothetical protein
VRRSLPLIPYCRLVVGSRFVKLGWCLEYRRRKYVESYRTVKMRLAKLSSQAQKGGTVLDCVGEVSSCRRGTLACAAVDGIPKFSNARSAPRGEVRHKTISGLNVRQKTGQSVHHSRLSPTTPRRQRLKPIFFRCKNYSSSCNTPCEHHRAPSTRAPYTNRYATTTSSSPCMSWDDIICD